MKNKLLRTFYSSLLYRIYLDFIYWKNKHNLEKELHASFSNYDVKSYYQQDQTQYKYQEGITQLKAKVRKAGNLEEYLKTVTDVFHLADIDNPEVIRMKQILRKFYVNKSVDVSTEKEKVGMIDQRINHYYELQKHKLEREQRRKERTDGKNT